MNQTLLDNWKNSNLIGLHRRLIELTKERAYHEWQVKLCKDEIEVISYYIGKREGQSDNMMENQS